MTRPPKAALFDLDGTLLDHVTAQRAALHGWLPEHALTEPGI
ncbi:MAG: hypothetical protein ACRDPJ_12245 [Nocardioidaceae bacterium]